MDLHSELIALFQIIVIDVVLAGDNAIVVGLAASRVAPELRAKVIFWGIAGAVVLPSSKLRWLSKLNDSKVLEAAEREELARAIKRGSEWGIGAVSNQVIDQIGIVKATRLSSIRRFFTNLSATMSRCRSGSRTARRASRTAASLTVTRPIISTIQRAPVHGERDQTRCSAMSPAIGTLNRSP